MSARRKDGRRGWPWGEVSAAGPVAGVRSGDLPRITVVTPSFNQAGFLEETILSVLRQGYPNLEYILMDGGSTDGSLEIIHRYEPWFTHWRSEKDNGQADAIYRGFEMATGDLLAWINSDDYYLPAAFMAAAGAYKRNPDAVLFVGGTKFIRGPGQPLRKFYPFRQDFGSLLCAGAQFGQMAAFWTREAFFRTGGFDRTLQYCFDYDMFLRLFKTGPTEVVDRMIAVHRYHEQTKTSLMYHTVGLDEVRRVRLRHGVGSLPPGEEERVRKEARDRFWRWNDLNYLKDLVRDPAYFFRALPVRARDMARRALGRGQ